MLQGEMAYISEVIQNLLAAEVTKFQFELRFFTPVASVRKERKYVSITSFGTT